MDLSKIEAFLENPNPQYQMRAITALRHYDADIVVPLLKQRMYDEKFMIRSFVVMGLGYKRNEEAYQALIDILENETDHNVLAEAANSLSKFGPQSLPHLVNIFERQPHWLIRQSIFAVMEDFDCPEVLLQLCQLGFQDPDLTVKLSAVSQLARLQSTPQQTAALGILLQAAINPHTILRVKAAKLLRLFSGPQAQAALLDLQQDEDYQVVKAVLEGLL